LYEETKKYNCNFHHPETESNLGCPSRLIRNLHL